MHKNTISFRYQPIKVIKIVSCRTMKEDFLYYIWQYHVRLQVKYKMTNGTFFIIQNKGIVNKDAGADISQVRLKIGDVEWNGSVEFHVKSSDWEQHGHQKDASYNNVLLHFVSEDDKVVYTQAGRPLPAFIFPNLQWYYEIFQAAFSEKSFIYCEKEINNVADSLRKMYLNRLVIERLEEKTDRVFQLLSKSKNSWEEVAYQVFIRYLGQKLNGDAFGQLARKTPLYILAKHSNSLLQIESLFFGQAGMLKEEGADDCYYLKLQKEYAFLRKKYNLHPMQGAEWKFLRLRPANFPTLRIAQMATLLHSSNGLFSQMLQAEQISDYRKLFSVGVSTYWKTHYVFRKKSKEEGERCIGKSLQEILVVNAVVPLLFAYGRYVGDDSWQEKALRLLQEIRAEQNFIISGFKELGFQVNNAFNSQAILQLYQKYCNFSHCEQCFIGYEILKQYYGTNK